MKKQNTKEKKKDGLSWWEWTLIILAILFIFDSLDNNKDYEYCVEYCVWDNSDCIYSSIEYVEKIGYLTYYNSEKCHNKLSSCLEDCKR